MRCFIKAILLNLVFRMTKIFLLITCLIFLLTKGLDASDSSLELHYLLLNDDAGNSLSEKAVLPGAELNLQMKYTRLGFSQESKTVLKIEIYDVKGNVVLQGEDFRPALEGTRRDLYRFRVPKEAGGKFLVAFTLRILEGDQVLAEVTREVPFDVAGS